jgi:hypothetical protein
VEHPRGGELAGTGSRVAPVVHFGAVVSCVTNAHGWGRCVECENGCVLYEQSAMYMLMICA